MKDFCRSFVHALAGVGFTIKTERNMRVHLCFAFYIILAGFVTGLAASEWAAVLLCIGAVTAAECVNTALERLCDTVHPDRSEGIKAAKDASAAAVLFVALAAAAVGCCIFFRQEKTAAAWSFAQNYPFPAAAIALSVIPLAIWAFKKRNEDKNI